MLIVIIMVGSMTQTEEVNKKAAFNNKEMGNQSIAAIFTILIEQWPVRISVDAGYIIGLLEEKYKPAKNNGVWDVNEGFVRIICDTFIWLKEENYIRLDKIEKGINYNGCVLNEKGLNTLNKIPDNLAGNKTFGELIVDNVRSNTKSSAFDKAGDFVGQMIGGIYKSTAQ